ncbi:MAG TPA: hypothetical protein VLV56_17175 [Burkholderiales bacterium]|nr:hypothetical protein [Burkholderiales bacterium]HUP09019.1 hypothetical protein [Caldimonas sp.]
MTTPRIRALLLALACLAGLAAAAPEKDIFDFVPQGGRTLLAKAFAAGAPAVDIRAIVGGKHTSDEWLAELRAREQSLPALRGLDDRQRRTLADYLAANMPLANPPADPAKANWERVLPPDGRDLVLNYCQGCHIITVVITQDRAKAAWLGTLGKPSHIQIKLTPAQRDALANYLIVNAAIPIDQVPEELRAGGATY